MPIWTKLVQSRFNTSFYVLFSFEARTTWFNIGPIWHHWSEVRPVWVAESGICRLGADARSRAVRSGHKLGQGWSRTVHNKVVKLAPKLTSNGPNLGLFKINSICNLHFSSPRQNILNFILKSPRFVQFDPIWMPILKSLDATGFH